MKVTVEFYANDMVIDAAVLTLLRDAEFPPSRIGIRAVRAAVAYIYEGFGTQANAGDMDELNMDEPTDDEYDAIQRVRTRLGI